MSEYHTATVQISTVYQGGDLFPAVILAEDDKWFQYILLGARDVRGAWIDKPSIRHAPKGNNRGAYSRQDQAFRTAFANSLQHAVNLLNGEKE
jgi:hypothetical protein